MVIQWYGESCFKIQTGGTVFLTDPFASVVGLTPPRGKYDAIVHTLISWPLPLANQGEGMVLMGAGEYEAGGVVFRGAQLPSESTDKQLKTIFRAEAEDITLGFLGHLENGLPPEAQDLVREVDLLFMPVGGKPFLSQEAAAKLVKQLNPKIIIGSLCRVPGLKRQSADWKNFAEEIGHKPEIFEKLTIKKKEVQEQKGMRFVVLQN